MWQSYIDPEKQLSERKFVIISLSICRKICFGCSKEPPQWGGSFEHPQHMFWLRDKITLSYLEFWIMKIFQTSNSLDKKLITLNLIKQVMPWKNGSYKSAQSSFWLVVAMLSSMHQVNP